MDNRRPRYNLRRQLEMLEEELELEDTLKMNYNDGMNVKEIHTFKVYFLNFISNHLRG